MVTTTTVTRQEIDYVLEDYRIHLTGAEADASEQEHAAPVANPPNWPTDRHRVPPLRPLNRNLNLEERPGGASVPENIFLGIMFSGVYINATTAKVWGMTGGKYFSKLFWYPVGGEW